MRRVTEEQKVVWRSRLDMDLVAVARAQGQACMQVFMVRGGKLIGQEHFILDGVPISPTTELTGEFLKQFYTARPPARRRRRAALAWPASRATCRRRLRRKRRSRRRAAAAAVPEGTARLRAARRTRDHRAVALGVKGQRVRILQPQRGVRADYLRLVQKNAEQNLKAFLAHQEVQETAQARSLTDLADALELPEPPHRIECYDVSNIQGTNPVASMVVFVEGRRRRASTASSRSNTIAGRTTSR